MVVAEVRSSAHTAKMLHMHDGMKDLDVGMRFLVQRCAVRWVRCLRLYLNHHITVTRFRGYHCMLLPAAAVPCYSLQVLGLLLTAGLDLLLLPALPP